MTKTWIGAPIACGTLIAVVLLAQDNPPPSQPDNVDIAGLPTGRGVYYHAASEWVALPYSVLMPMAEGRSVVTEVLNVGSDHAAIEMSGSHAGVQIGNDARPTFYLHGIVPAKLNLVRAVSRADYRELRMPISRHFREWAHFRAQDISELEIQPLGGDIMTVKPRADLKPGEYAFASGMEPSDSWILIGYDFGIVAGRAGQ